MNEKPANRRLPRCSFAALLHFLDSQRGHVPPPRIDLDLFTRGHRRVGSSIIDSLAALNLIGPDGEPTRELAEMIAAPDARKLHLRSALRHAYPTLEALPANDTDLSAEQFEEHVRRLIAGTQDRATQFVVDASRYLVSA